MRVDLTPEAEPVGASRSGLLMRRDLVVAVALELQQAEAMPERIGEQCHPAPGVLADRTLARRAGAVGALDGGVDVVDGEVEVDRRPVPAGVARSGRGRRRRGA